MAKIIFAQQVTVVHESFGPHIGREAWTHNAFLTKVQQKRLSLQVSNVSSGLVKDIANQPLGELVSATGNTLDLGPGIAGMSSSIENFTAQEMMAEVRWSDPILPLPATLNDLIKLDGRYNCTDYSSATLAADFGSPAATTSGSGGSMPCCGLSSRWLWRFGPL